MAAELFPRELTRKQYGLRLLAIFAFVAVGLWLFVAALISGYVYLAWVLVAYVYAGFGLAVPRLRNAGQGDMVGAVLLYSTSKHYRSYRSSFYSGAQPTATISPDDVATAGRRDDDLATRLQSQTAQRQTRL